MCIYTAFVFVYNFVVSIEIPMSCYHGDTLQLRLYMYTFSYMEWYMILFLLQFTFACFAIRSRLNLLNSSLRYIVVPSWTVFDLKFKFDLKFNFQEVFGDDFAATRNPSRPSAVFKNLQQPRWRCSVCELLLHASASSNHVSLLYFKPFRVFQPRVDGHHWLWKVPVRSSNGWSLFCV